MKSSPWYSTDRDVDVTTLPIHHNNMICKEGKAIEKNYRRYGTDNRPLCKRCGALNNAGK